MTGPGTVETWWPCLHDINSEYIELNKHAMQNLLDEEVVELEHQH